MVEDPANVARFLAAMGEATGVPRRSPGRGRPYWKSRVLRRQALGDEDDGQGLPPLRASSGVRQGSGVRPLSALDARSAPLVMPSLNDVDDDGGVIADTECRDGNTGRAG